MNKDLLSPETLARMRELSGENAASSNFTFIPVVSVSNEKETKTVDGEEVEVLKKKEYLVTDKEGNDFVSKSYATSFDGIIVKVRYYVNKKYKKGDSTGFWKSREFNSFGNTNIELRQEGNTFWTGSYNDFKVEFEGQYDLYVRLYVITDIEKEEMVRVDLKGASRSSFWDYMRSFDNNDSLSAHWTSFKVEKQKGDSFSFHVASFEPNDKKELNIEEVLNIQEQLNTYFNFKSEKPNDQEPIDDKELEEAFNQG